MPRLDGTGPNGMGPMTGRGLGYCVTGIPRVARFCGRGFRRAFLGRRLGTRRSFYSRRNRRF